MGAVDGFMTTGAPAGAPREESGVIPAADDDAPGRGLLLEMALETEVGAAGDEHLVVHGAVDAVARGTAFADGLMFEHEGPALRGVALVAGLVLGDQGGAAPLGVAAVRIVAIGAGHFTAFQGVMVREIELAALVQMTLETDLRGATGIDDVLAAAPGLAMQAAGTVARFASGLGRMGAPRLEACMVRPGEGAGDILMALGAIAGADEGGARDGGWYMNRSLHAGAGHKKSGDAHRRYATNDPASLDTGKPR